MTVKAFHCPSGPYWIPAMITPRKTTKKFQVRGRRDSFALGQRIEKPTRPRLSAPIYIHRDAISRSSMQWVVSTARYAFEFDSIRRWVNILEMGGSSLQERWMQRLLLLLLRPLAWINILLNWPRGTRQRSLAPFMEEGT